jgi:hypothetical protein
MVPALKSVAIVTTCVSCTLLVLVVSYQLLLMHWETRYHLIYPRQQVMLVGTQFAHVPSRAADLSANVSKRVLLTSAGLQLQGLLCINARVDALESRIQCLEHRAAGSGIEDRLQVNVSHVTGHLITCSEN